MTSEAGRWTFVDNSKFLIGFLGAAIAVLGIGVASVLVAGAEAASAASVLLSIGVFLVVFAVLLLVPRLSRRGPKSFRLLVDLGIDHVEREVRGALEASGRSVRVDVVPSRFARPPRILSADGIPWKIRLENVPKREIGEPGIERTEVVQVGVDTEEDADARVVRELVAARLSGQGATAT